MSNYCVSFNKMKIIKLLFTSGALLFGLSIICISLYQEHCYSDKTNKQVFFIFGQASAMTEKVITEKEVTEEEQIKSQDATSSAEATQSANVIAVKTDYYLPYPGILPDHPLYWLKMLRDKIVLKLTNDPQSRFERLLLYADKRIGAAEVLVKGRKFDLGVSTTLKSENYLDQAAQQLQQLSENNKATAIMKDQIENSTTKHRQILEIMRKETEVNQGAIDQMIKLNLKIKKEIKGFN